jgi:competence protein ComGF
MKKRIRELATEVGISVEYLTNTKQWTLIEALAELIVRESIVDFYRRYLDLESEEDITEQVNRYVKDNFGVK